MSPWWIWFKREFGLFEAKAWIEFVRCISFLNAPFTWLVGYYGVGFCSEGVQAWWGPVAIRVVYPIAGIIQCGDSFCFSFLKWSSWFGYDNSFVLMCFTLLAWVKEGFFSSTGFSTYFPVLPTRHPRFAGLTNYGRGITDFPTGLLSGMDVPLSKCWTGPNYSSKRAYNWVVPNRISGLTSVGHEKLSSLTPHSNTIKYTNYHTKTGIAIRKRKQRNSPLWYISR